MLKEIHRASRVRANSKSKWVWFNLVRYKIDNHQWDILYTSLQKRTLKNTHSNWEKAEEDIPQRTQEKESLWDSEGASRCTRVRTKSQQTPCVTQHQNYPPDCCTNLSDFSPNRLLSLPQNRDRLWSVKLCMSMFKVFWYPAPLNIYKVICS